MNYRTCLIIIAVLTTLSCVSEERSKTATEKPTVVLGQLQHNFTLNPATRKDFNEGLLLLHNFEYDDALVRFEAATAADSTEVMTHWGEAMCHYKALWRLQNTENGKAILQRLGNSKAERLASISDPIERDLWEVVELMYGEGEFEERNERIARHLGELHAQYPQHQEIAAFYALSLIWATDTYGDGSEDLRLAASVADKIIAVNPLHPGALHYKIHALDGPTSAEAAHAAADAYAQVATDAAHALHMPSHIYLALGEWEGVVNSNRVSYDASVKRMKKLDLNDGARGYHSLAWLHYGLLQQGRYVEAEQILADMLEYVPKDPTKGARGYLLGMQSRQLAERGAVSSNVELNTDVEVDDIGLVPQSVRSFLRAQLAFAKEDSDVLRKEINWLSQKTALAADQINVGGLLMCAAGTSRYAPTDNAIKIARVVTAQMRGMLALLEGQDADFETHLQAAVALERQTDYPAGPPRITQPSFEQYGAWLLDQGRPADAIVQFDAALERMPRRSKALLGKLKALKALDQTSAAESIQRELQSILAQADGEVIGML